MSIFAKAGEWVRRPFPATRALARLGVIAATLCGLALAFHVGGRDGYALPLTALLGAPANVTVLRLLQLVHRIPHDAIWSGADWNIYLLLFCACVALNWTLVGVAADLLGGRPPSPSDNLSDQHHPLELTEPGFDALGRDFEELERRVRERDRPSSRRAWRGAA